MAVKIPVQRSWWFSCSKMTVFADCDNDVIYDCSDIVQKFKGQEIRKLAQWMRGIGGFKWKEIDPPANRSWRKKKSV